MSVVNSYTVTANTPLVLTSPTSISSWLSCKIDNLTTGSLAVSLKADTLTIPQLTSGTIVNPGMLASFTVTPDVTGSLKVTWNLPGDPVLSLVPISATNINVGGTINLAAGTTVDVTNTVQMNVASSSITLPITGSVSITSGTVDIGSAPALDINNVAGGVIDIQTINPANSLGASAVLDNPVQPPAAPTVTPVGTTGTTTYYYQQSFLTDPANSLETPASSVTLATNGNAALSSANFFQLKTGLFSVPSGPGNLIYDSLLVHAIDAVNPTWFYFVATIGTANGDWNIQNSGTDTASWYYIGTGAAEGFQGVGARGVAVTPGDTWTLAWTGAVVPPGIGFPSWIISSRNSFLADVLDVPIAAPAGSRTFTVPAGVTSLFVQTDTINLIVPAGVQMVFGTVQLTKTSSVQPFQPGPLWTLRTYRNGFHVPALDTTALVANDEGQAASTRQPPVFNNTGQMLKIYSKELDSVLSPIRFAVPLQTNDNGSTVFPAMGGFLTWPAVAAGAPPDLLAMANSVWYLIANPDINMIVAAVSITNTNLSAGVNVALGILKLNGIQLYLGTVALLAGANRIVEFGKAGVQILAGEYLLVYPLSGPGVSVYLQALFVPE